MERITERVTQVGAMGVNTFIVEVGEGQLAVVDAGMPGHHKRIIPAARQMGYPPHAITDVFITHADLDHVGGLGKLAAITGAEVHTGHMAAALMEAGEAPSHGSAVFDLIAGAMQKVLLKPLYADHIYEDGDEAPFGLQVIESPGHTPDHIAFYWPEEGVLFAGDLFNRFQPALQLSPPMMSWNMDAAHQSAAKVLATDPRIICVGHGGWVDVSADPQQVAGLG
jgi:glyoxylase-like metal-dependent hydrolase (beta-lactamase superfamily II)